MSGDLFDNLMKGISKDKMVHSLLSKEEREALEKFHDEAEKIEKELIDKYGEGSIPEEFDDDWVCDEALKRVPGAEEALDKYVKLDSNSKLI